MFKRIAAFVCLVAAFALVGCGAIPCPFDSKTSKASSQEMPACSRLHGTAYVEPHYMGLGGGGTTTFPVDAQRDVELSLASTGCVTVVHDRERATYVVVVMAEGTNQSVGSGMIGTGLAGGIAVAGTILAAPLLIPAGLVAVGACGVPHDSSATVTIEINGRPYTGSYSAGLGFSGVSAKLHNSSTGPAAYDAVSKWVRAEFGAASKKAAS